MTTGGVRRLLAGAGLFLLPATAHAHLVNTGLGPFYDGVSHFGLTPEDALPALALAFLAGQRGAAPGRTALFVLPGAWLVGGAAGLSLPGLAAFAATGPLATVLTTLSFVLLGGLVAAEAPLGPRWVAGLAVAVGLLHGGLNGAAMAEAKLGALGLAGIVTALFVVVALGAALVVAIRVAWGRIAVRVAGSWIAAVGLLLVGWAFRSR